MFGALRINIDSREVHIDDTPIMLTRTEFDVLAALSSRPGAVLSRRQLLESVSNQYGATRGSATTTSLTSTLGT